jgi:hypothetical protein
MPNTHTQNQHLFCPICGQSHCNCEFNRPISSRQFTPGEALRSVPFQYGSRSELTANGRRIGSVASWTPQPADLDSLLRTLDDPQGAIVTRHSGTGTSSYQTYIMGRWDASLIYSRDALKAFLKSRGFKRYIIWISEVEPTIFLKIQHFWFRLSKFEADLKNYNPLGVKYVCTKMTFREWVNRLRLIRRLTIGYRLAHRKRHIHYTKFDLCLEEESERKNVIEKSSCSR